MKAKSTQTLRYCKFTVNELLDIDEYVSMEKTPATL